MMGEMQHPTAQLPIGFTPGISVGDPLAAYWLGQVTVTLRREVAWLWHERGTLRGMEGEGTLPPAIDGLSDALDLMRFDGDRRRFFETDETGRYLSDLLAGAVVPDGSTTMGGFGWLAERLKLAPVECFALALALGGAIDGARGAVIAACQSDTGSVPTLGLLQRLWPFPDDVLRLFDPAHPLAASGVLHLKGEGWSAEFLVSPLVARQLLYPSEDLPQSLAPVIGGTGGQTGPAENLAAARLRTRSLDRLTFLPLVGALDAPFGPVAAQIAGAAGLTLCQPRGRGPLDPLIVLAWLRGVALIVPYETLSATDTPVPKLRLPVAIFVMARDGDALSALPPRETLPKLKLKPLAHDARLTAWVRALPELAASEAGLAHLRECARRFRFEEAAIRRVADEIHALDVTPTRERLFEACRDDLNLGDLAQPVEARFTLDELMLPGKQAGQIDELIQAVGALARVHHDWGLARAWNESGLSVLFTGPPGTGKTMAAEAISTAVQMPMFRIDLSQVVNKYIGETEKNLRKLFDAADCGDAILFFDEADALFGKRTEVKDAHDRYANLEVSYLLERMERFRGMAILASNRRKDLDEAFLRRLRYIVNFPLPGPEERLRIWQSVMPKGVDTSSIDLDFLAERLPLSGGYIRSAVFNACLQSAKAGGPSTLEMGAVVRAVKAEFDKLGRTVSLDQFGRYAGEVRHDS